MEGVLPGGAMEGVLPGETAGDSARNAASRSLMSNQVLLKLAPLKTRGLRLLAVPVCLATLTAASALPCVPTLRGRGSVLLV